MTNTTQVHLYGKLCCRGTTETITGIVDISDINSALDFNARNALEQDVDDAVEVFTDQMGEKYDSDITSMLYELCCGAMNDLNLDQWNDQVRLGVILEEFEFAVGPSKVDAMLTFVELYE